MTIEPMTIEIAEATRIVPASAEDIFELLASPAQHALIDGSGTVKGVQRGTPERLSPGARFGMNMRIGAPYKILNEVVEFEEGRRIAWRHFAGHIWRYILEPLGPNTTQVTEMASFQEVATGLNYKVNANLVVRPEVKWNWTGSDDNFRNATGVGFNDTLFGMDAIYTF